MHSNDIFVCTPAYSGDMFAGRGDHLQGADNPARARHPQAAEQSPFARLGRRCRGGVHHGQVEAPCAEVRSLI